MTKSKLKFYKFYYKNLHNAHIMHYCNNDMCAQYSNNNSKEKYIFSHLI